MTLESLNFGPDVNRASDAHTQLRAICKGLSRRRRELDMTVEALAEASLLSVSKTRKILAFSGDTSAIPAFSLLMLADALGLTLAEAAAIGTEP